MARVLGANGVWQEVAVDTPTKKVEPKKEEATPSKPSTNTTDAQKNVGDTTVGEENAREYEEEKYVLEGDANVFPDPRLKSKATVSIFGIGNYLSGLYYVTQVKHSWSSNGYTQSMTVKKNGFNGQSLKSPSDDRREQVNVKKESE